MTVAATAIDDLLVTRGGYERLRAELEELGDGRRQLDERVLGVRPGGDLADTAAYFDLLEEKAQLERRIAWLEEHVHAVTVVDPPADGTAGIGSHVRVRDLADEATEQYELVGAVETEVGNGRVSIGAPVGRALAGARAGDVAEVTTPSGRRRLELLEVRPQPFGGARGGRDRSNTRPGVP